MQSFKEAVKKVFSRKNYVKGRLWLRRRVVDASFVVPRSWRLTAGERYDADAYREERVFEIIGSKDENLKKHVRAVATDEQARRDEFVPPEPQRFGEDPVLDKTIVSTGGPPPRVV